MRSMVHVEIIDSIRPIENADAIEVARVLGWDVVIKKNEYKVGQKVLYFEIDSWVSINVAPFLRKNPEKIRTYNGVDGERLRTIRLRGQISQGLLLPIPDDFQDYEPGKDVTEAMGVQKWEPEIPVQLAGLCRGNFPSQVQKTDQPRIQNEFNRIKRMIDAGEIRDEWFVQEKLEGSSMQVAKIKNGEEYDYHVLSRNLSLKLDQEGNAYVDMAKKDRLIELLQSIETEYPTVSIQGELIGPGIQGNIYNLSTTEYHIFDIWVGTRHLSVPEIMDFRERAKEIGFNLKFVPMEPAIIKGIFSGENALDNIIKSATGYSALNGKQLREGLVFKNMHNPNVTFKAISNEYLIKQKD